MSETIFSKIIRGEIPCHRVYEDDRVLAFLDINPLSHGHVLVIPKRPIPSLDDLAPGDEQLIGHLYLTIARIAKELGLTNGYRVVVNCGRDAGQSVDHLHFHLLGGRTLNWPPG